MYWLARVTALVVVGGINNRGWCPLRHHVSVASCNLSVDGFGGDFWRICRVASCCWQRAKIACRTAVRISVLLWGRKTERSLLFCQASRKHVDRGSNRVSQSQRWTSWVLLFNNFLSLLHTNPADGFISFHRPFFFLLVCTTRGIAL